jgi:hypothetical protein
MPFTLLKSKRPNGKNADQNPSSPGRASPFDDPHIHGAKRPSNYSKPSKAENFTKHRPCIHSYLILKNGSENGEARRDVEKLSSCRVVFGASLPLQVGNCLGSIIRVGNVRCNENVSFLVVSCFPSPVACSFVSSLVA